MDKDLAVRRAILETKGSRVYQWALQKHAKRELDAQEHSEKKQRRLLLMSVIKPPDFADPHSLQSPLRLEGDSPGIESPKFAENAILKTEASAVHTDKAPAKRARMRNTSVGEFGAKLKHKMFDEKPIEVDLEDSQPLIKLQQIVAKTAMEMEREQAEMALVRKFMQYKNSNLRTTTNVTQPPRAEYNLANLKSKRATKISESALDERADVITSRARLL